jgi:hypothetical protein
MLGLWHRDIRNRLIDLKNDAEDWWWNPHLVPADWERYVDASIPVAPASDAPEAKSHAAGEPEGKDSADSAEVLAPEGDNDVPAPEDNEKLKRLVESFIERCFREAGFRPTKTMIWRAGGYTDHTEFYRWLRKDPDATATANKNFRRVLSMDPCDFAELLKKLGLR